MYTHTENQTNVFTEYKVILALKVCPATITKTQTASPETVHTTDLSAECAS